MEEDYYYVCPIHENKTHPKSLTNEDDVTCPDCGRRMQKISRLPIRSPMPTLVPYPIRHLDEDDEDADDE